MKSSTYISEEIRYVFMAVEDLVVMIQPATKNITKTNNRIEPRPHKMHR